MASLEDIRNFYAVNQEIASSGQPQVEQFKLIADAGYHSVINLALPTSRGAIAEEGSIVTGLDMTYLHLPVKFEAPTVRDAQLFFAAVKAMASHRVWIHCVVSARVSAFLFHFLRYEFNLTDEQATTPVMRAWLPQMDAVWQDFLTLTKAQITQGYR
tara:strand:- start:1326 stop:1796 length:471 start_codon:yes stop_codon:yes gene_type:complete